jgi:NADPH-dependent 2,4-dienoyl-CoA reductase/sulfur reductase-like enzyme
VNDTPSSLAAELWRDGIRGTRSSVRHGEPRAALCGMGTCQECRVVTRDGHTIRACTTYGDAVADTSQTPRAKALATARTAETALPILRADVVVVGAGPAGCTAALEAAAHGASVLLLDEHTTVGGPIWRPGPGAQPPRRALRLAMAVDRSAGIEHLRGVQVVDARPAAAKGGEHELSLLDRSGEPLAVRAPAVVLACGSVERFVPFPGWTLPGVTGAGGLQSLVKGGLDVAGRRIVVAGTGPLLLSVAAFLKARGAEVVGPFEQAPARALRHFVGSLAISQPGRLLQAARLAWTAGLPFGPRTDTWPIAALAQGQGDERRVGAVVLRHANGKTWQEPADLLACGFGLAPRIELAALLGCVVETGEGGARVACDERGATSVAGVHACGETTGIAGVDAAIVEGRIAGRAVVGNEDGVREAVRGRMRTTRFAHLLERTFALRPELHDLPDATTTICRCEDVEWAAIRDGDHFDARDAKLKTRCGMGVCQGKVCGPALEFLRGWRRDRIRPPLAPVPLAALARLAEAADETANR